MRDSLDILHKIQDLEDEVRDLKTDEEMMFGTNTISKISKLQTQIDTLKWVLEMN